MSLLSDNIAIGGIIPEIEGFQNFDYSFPIMTGGLSTMVYIIYEEGYFDYIGVFDIVVWVIFFIVFFLTGLLFWVYEKDSKAKYNIKLTHLENILKALFNTFELIFSVIEKPIKTISARILLIGFFIFISILSDYYISYQVRKTQNKLGKVYCLCIYIII